MTTRIQQAAQMRRDADVLREIATRADDDALHVRATQLEASADDVWPQRITADCEEIETAAGAPAWSWQVDVALILEREPVVHVTVKIGEEGYRMTLPVPIAAAVAGAITTVCEHPGVLEAEADAIPF